MLELRVSTVPPPYSNVLLLESISEEEALRLFGFEAPQYGVFHYYLYIVLVGTNVRERQVDPFFNLSNMSVSTRPV